MACDIERIGNAVVVRWGEPTSDDVRNIFALMVEAHERTHEKLVFVAWVPVGAPAPSASVRETMMELQPQLLEVVREVHMVFEGHGFATTIKRSVMLGFIMAAQRRKTYFVHASSEQARRGVQARDRADVELGLSLLATRASLSRVA